MLKLKNTATDRISKDQYFLDSSRSKISCFFSARISSGVRWKVEPAVSKSYLLHGISGSIGANINNVVDANNQAPALT